MGLKIRRLKSGFAYYAEYKFGGHCVYETIKAASVREAKRRYATRYKELRGALPPDSEPKSITRREAHESQINAVLASLLNALIARNVLTAAEARDLLENAFRQLNALPAVLSHSAITAQARDALRHQILARLPEPHSAVELVPEQAPIEANTASERVYG